MSPGAALVASFLVALVRPETWALALASFLLRGGILLVLVPIVVVPSAVGAANVLAPMITSVVFGGVSTALITTVVTATATLVAWIVIGGLVAAAAEAAGTVIVATDEDVLEAAGASSAATIAGRVDLALARRVLTVRLIAHLPLLLALAWGAFRIVSATYRELTLPTDVVTPLIIRVAQATPDAVALLALSWLFGEVLGVLAARRVVQAGDGVLPALTAAIGRMVRHPIRTAVITVAPLAALFAVAVPCAAAASASWGALRSSLATDAASAVTLVLLIAFLVLWVGGLVLLAVIAAWRGAAWTVETAGTFGGATPDRPGG